MKNVENKKIVLVKCTVLSDQFECDADRKVLGVYDINDPVVASILKNKDAEYEVYDITKKGNCVLNEKMSTYKW